MARCGEVVASPVVPLRRGTAVRHSRAQRSGVEISARVDASNPSERTGPGVVPRCNLSATREDSMEDGSESRMPPPNKDKFDRRMGAQTRLCGQ
jgi:hypothetical protein